MSPQCVHLCAKKMKDFFANFVSSHIWLKWTDEAFCGSEKSLISIAEIFAIDKLG